MFSARFSDWLFKRAVLLACVGAGFVACARSGQFARVPASAQARAQANKQGENASGRLVVVVSGFRNDAGTARAALFRTPDGFPNDAAKAFRLAAAEIRDRAATLVFEDVPFGAYAVAVLHDENDNGQLDVNAAGIPLEGYGASNNRASVLGPPAFEAAVFALEFLATTLAITVKYVL